MTDAASFPWGDMIVQTLAVIAVSFVLLVAITSFVRYRLLTDPVLVKTDPNASWADRFRIRLLAWIGAYKRDGFVAGILRASPPPGPDAAAALQAVLDAELRPDDEILADADGSLGLLWKADDREVHRVARRLLRDAGHALPKTRLSASFARYPDDGNTPEALFDALDAGLAREGDEPIRFAGAVPGDPEPSAAPPEGMDPVTGLLPYEGAERFLQKYLANQRRKDHPVSFILLAVDRIADLKERHGEEAIHAFLAELTAVLLDELREADPVTRWDGDGFMIAVAAPPDAAETLARRIALLVEHQVFLKANRKLRVRVSAGVTGFPDVSGGSGVYLEAVEDALRTAIDRGGKQVLRYDPSMRRATADDQPQDVL